MKPVVRLRARLYRVSLVRWVDIPLKALAGIDFPPAENRGWLALLRFNDDLDRVTLLPGKRGHRKVAFKVELLKAAGVEAGDFVEFTLEPDTTSREPDLPEEMRKVFQARPALRERWLANTLATRRQVVRYIEEAKSPEVRAKRSWIFLERLAETGKLGA